MSLDKLRNELLKYIHGKFFTVFLRTDTLNHFASCYTPCFHTFSDMHLNRGSEWGLVFSVIWPQKFLVFAVKLANFLMFSVSEGRFFGHL